MTDWVVHGTAPWDAAWLTEHNLAASLARSGRVLFVEPPISPLTPVRHGIGRHSMDTAGRLTRRSVRLIDGVHVCSPLAFPPLSNRRARRVSAPLLRRQIARAARIAGVREPATLAARWMLDLRGAPVDQGLVYLVKDWIEDGAELLGRNSETLARERDEMCRSADAVCAISPGLREALADRGVAATVLLHAFDKSMLPLFESVRPAPEIAGLPRPLIGFTGRIDGRLDYEALAAIAGRFADGTVLLLGPRSPRLEGSARAVLDSTPNLRVHGPVPRRSIPAIVSGLDCAVMPYRPTEWIRRAAPLKLWDYLCAGPPLVGSGCELLSDLPSEVVRFVSNPSDWPDAVAAALTEGRANAAHRRALALANTWDARAWELSALVSR